MSVSAEDGTIRVLIGDEGRGIDALQLPHATLMRGYSTVCSMGLGFTLIHELADRLYMATDTGGTTLIIEMAVHPTSREEKALAMLDAIDL